MTNELNMSMFNLMHEEVIETVHRKNNPAGFMHERLMRMIEAHQKSLPADFELGIQVIGGSAPAIHLRQITYSNPDILIFRGKDAAGNAVQLVQHHTQMSVVFLAIPKLEERAYRIGFTG